MNRECRMKNRNSLSKPDYVTKREISIEMPHRNRKYERVYYFILVYIHIYVYWAYYTSVGSLCSAYMLFLCVYCRTMPSTRTTAEPKWHSDVSARTYDAFSLARAVYVSANPNIYMSIYTRTYGLRVTFPHLLIANEFSKSKNYFRNICKIHSKRPMFYSRNENPLFSNNSNRMHLMATWGPWKSENFF